MEFMDRIYVSVPFTRSITRLYVTHRSYGCELVPRPWEVWYGHEARLNPGLIVLNKVRVNNWWTKGWHKLYAWKQETRLSSYCQSRTGLFLSHKVSWIPWSQNLISSLEWILGHRSNTHILDYEVAIRMWCLYAYNFQCSLQEYDCMECTQVELHTL